VYTGDWLRSEAASMMRPEEEGAFWRLLLIAWGDGEAEPSLPEDATALARMSRLGSRWASCGPIILGQFERRGGRLFNSWLSSLWSEQQAKHQKLAEAGAKGGKAKSKSRPRSSDAKASLKPRLPDASSDAQASLKQSESESDKELNRGLYEPSGLAPLAPSGAGASESPRTAGADGAEHIAADDATSSGGHVNGRRGGGAPTTLADVLADVLPAAARARPRKVTLEERERAIAWASAHPSEARVVQERIATEWKDVKNDDAIRKMLISGYVQAMRAAEQRSENGAGEPETAAAAAGGA
jgi:uncharacterized protein YdaU (DUF1376 family)